MLIIDAAIAAITAIATDVATASIAALATPTITAAMAAANIPGIATAIIQAMARDATTDILTHTLKVTDMRGRRSAAGRRLLAVVISAVLAGHIIGQACPGMAQ